MAALPTVEQAGIDFHAKELALLPRESGEYRVTIRVDNYSHILSAYGEAAVEAAAATVDLIIGELRAGGCSVRSRRPGLIDISFSGQGEREIVRIIEAAITALSCNPVRLGNLDFHLALTAHAFADSDGSVLPLPFAACQPIGDGEDWASRYRDDMGIAVDVMAALAERRIELGWQPVRSAGSPGQALYHEGLARVVGADGELLSPSSFVPALERLGMARAFDRQIMTMVLDELEHFPGARLGVNISGQSARRDDWWASMFERLEAAPSVARRLVVEITETAALDGAVLGFVEALRRLGCRVALDDFGVGHASVRNAMILSPDIIKVDAFFLRRAGFSDRAAALLDHLIGIAAHCAPIVIVEGVETTDQSRLAAQLQERYQSPANLCWQQGYHFGAPTFWREWRYPSNDPQVVPLSSISRKRGAFRPWTDLTARGQA